MIGKGTMSTKLPLILLTFLKTNRTTESRLYESSLKVTPTNTRLLNNLGRLYEKDGRTAEAISLYKKAIEYVLIYFTLQT